MATPTIQDVSELLAWEAPHGVLSVYVDTHPGDRGDGWRTELRNGLHAAVAAVGDDSRARARVEEAGKSLLDRLTRDGFTPRRSEICFCAPGTDLKKSFSLSAPLHSSRVSFGRAAGVRPLLALIDDFPPSGVMVVSGERVRLLDYGFGELHEVEDWQLEIFEDEWRDRRAPRVHDVVTGGTSTSSSGRDLADQRMAESRDRFVGEVAGIVSTRAGSSGWREVLAFGEERYVERLRKVLGNTIDVVHVDHSNLIAEPAPAIAARVSAYMEGANRRRELALLDRVEAAAYAKGVTGGGALGPIETAQALALGRVSTLLIDADREFEPLKLDDFSSKAADGDGSAVDAPPLPVAEQLVDMALRTDAKVVPLEGEAAERLAEHQGAAALLRY